MNIKIIGSGSYIPDLIVDNQSFEHNIFLDESGMLLNQPNTQNNRPANAVDVTA